LNADPPKALEVPKPPVVPLVAGFVVPPKVKPGLGVGFVEPVPNEKLVLPVEPKLNDILIYFRRLFNLDA
jgi:hypothetical protein